MALALGFSYWFPGLLFLPLPFFLLLGVCVFRISFTLEEIVGIEGLVVESFGFLAGLDSHEGWLEPTTPSKGVSLGGLTWSMLGQGASWIRSYRVSNCK